MATAVHSRTELEIRVRTRQPERLLVLMLFFVSILGRSSDLDVEQL